MIRHLRLAAALTLCAALALAADDDAHDDVVARVNGNAVTRAELERVLADPAERHRLEDRTHDGRELAEVALAELVDRRLLLQEAERRDIAVSGDEVDRALRELRGRFGELDELATWMRQRGLDDSTLLEAVREQVLLRKLWAELAEVDVTDAEVREYFEEHRHDVQVSTEVRLAVIAVDSPSSAENVLAELHAGASFAHVARERSQGRRAAYGGDIGWHDLRALSPPLAAAVVQLGVGDVAGPLQREDGSLLLVGLIARRPVLAETLAEARAEIERRLLPDLQARAVRDWLGRQAQASTIERLGSAR